MTTPDWLERVKYDEKGLIPCVVQSRATSEVLMLAYMNDESLARTLSTGEMWYWSRSRGGLWHKGATSGALQKLVTIHLDCDGDTLLALVDQQGQGACHTGAISCFDPADGSREAPGPRHILAELYRMVADRDRERPEGSYTTKLLVGGVDRSGKKVGEEAVEVVIAAKNAIFGNGTAELAEESADLLYHLLVLWRSAGIEPVEIAEALLRRR